MSRTPKNDGETISRTPPRNRLAKPLPDRWRQWLVEQGVPRRKYTAVCNATLTTGEAFQQLVIEEGWIIAVGTDVLDETFEQRIGFDPEAIDAMTLEMVV
ncbi:MAG: hypothetical protein AAGK78_12730 [Planctomycetota bacterium]